MLTDAECFWCGDQVSPLDECEVLIDGHVEVLCPGCYKQYQYEVLK